MRKWIHLVKMKTTKLINFDEEIFGGEAVFNGTRVPIKFLLEYMEDGETVEEFVDNFSSVALDQALTMMKMFKQYGKELLQNQQVLDSISK